MVENTVGKGEIASFEQFLLYPQCFQKTCTADLYKPGLVWERVKSICRQQNKCDSKTDTGFGRGRKHRGNRRKCRLPAFSPFPTMFSKGYFLEVVKSRDCVVKSSTDFLLKQI